MFGPFSVIGDGGDYVSGGNVLQQGLVFVVDDEGLVVQDGGVGDVHCVISKPVSEGNKNKALFDLL